MATDDATAMKRNIIFFCSVVTIVLIAVLAIVGWQFALLCLGIVLGGMVILLWAHS